MLCYRYDLPKTCPQTLTCLADNNDESNTWEHDYLARDDVRVPCPFKTRHVLTKAQVSPLLASEAVTLRIEASSQEEGFLTQLYPIPKRPTLIVIK